MFLILDALRRQRGLAWDALGFGPRQAPYRIIAERPGMRLRAYEGPAGELSRDRPAVLILPAPFKRSYIWDLRPDVSVVRRCQENGLAVFLLEWRDPMPGEDLGLDDFAETLPAAAVQAITDATGRAPVVLAGHSLGGTLAAIFAALHPEHVRDLWLIDAPLVFAPEHGDRLAATLRGIDLDWLAGAAGDPVAGSFISAFTVAALPDEFVWGPAADLLASGWDADRHWLHAQVLRWTLDEYPLPRRLFMDVAQQLYREDRFRNGSLAVGSRHVGLRDLQASVAAVLNRVSSVVPTASVLDALRLTRSPSISTFTYEPDVGCAIQHVGPLVSPGAHAHIWPSLTRRVRSP
jgi:polyhydroxyalkanoate synthase